MFGGIRRHPETIAEHFIATARRDFEMIALSYGQQFLRDGAERLVIRLKGCVRCMLRQDLIRFPRRRAYLAAVDRDCRNLRAIEIHQGVEEIENYRLIRFHAAPSVATV